jgi:hypothetical protein
VKETLRITEIDPYLEVFAVYGLERQTIAAAAAAGAMTMIPSVDISIPRF